MSMYKVAQTKCTKFDKRDKLIIFIFARYMKTAIYFF